MVAGREVARLVNEHKYTQHVGRGSKHHEQTSSVQIEFKNKCKRYDQGDRRNGNFIFR